MITTFLPSINHALPAETVRTLRIYTRELREYIQSSLNRFPILFYQKKADGKKKHTHTRGKSICILSLML